MLSFKPTFSLSTFTFINKLFSSSSLSAIRVVSSAYLRLLIYYVIFLSGFFHLAHMFSSFQFSSVTQLCPTLCDPMDCSMPGVRSITNSRSLLKLIELVMSSNHLILCRPLLLLPSIFPSIRVFSNESALHIRWPKY